MSERKHTPLTINGNFIESLGRTPIFVRSDSLRDFLVLACNSYYQDQKTIATLVGELQASANRLNTVIDSGLLCDDMKRSLQKQVRYSEAALALAKKD